MIEAKATEKLTGVTIQGDYDDFYQLTEAFHNAAGLDLNPKDPYYSVGMRALGVCYDIRKAYQGDRDIILRDNGMHEESMKWHNLITPKQNVYYSVNILFPEVLFAAMSVQDLCGMAKQRPGNRKGDEWARPYTDVMFLKDKAVLKVFAVSIWEAFAGTIGSEEADKVLRLYQRTDESYYQYVTQYVDQLNIEYLRTAVDKRPDKLRNIAKRIARKPDAYYRLENEMKYQAKKLDTTIHDLVDANVKYPEEIEW